MKITLHQMTCGEGATKGWSLLQSTLPDKSVSEKIAFHTNLQDEPHGTRWNPAIRGFAKEGYYLFLITFRDSSPDVRPNRAFSHVVLIEIEKIAEINNIEQILEILPREIDKETALLPITIETGQQQDFARTPNYKNRFRKLVHGFVNGSDYKNTAIWIDEEDFKIACSDLWRIFTYNERKSFAFGFAFNPINFVNGHFHLIMVPSGLEAKFINAGFLLIKGYENFATEDYTEKFLLQDQVVISSVNSFSKSVGKQITDITEIQRLSRVIETFENIGNVTDLKKFNSLAHVIDQYSPDKDNSILIKENLLQRFKEIILQSNPKDLLVINRFPISSFKDAETFLSASSEKWLDAFVQKPVKVQPELIPLLKEILSNDSWWNITIRKKIKSFLDRLSKPKILNFLAWTATDQDIKMKLTEYLEKTYTAETLFIKVLKALPVVQTSISLSFALSMGWLRLHAEILKRSLDFKSALKKQMEVDTNENFSEGIQTITKGADNNEIITSAYLFDDSRMVAIASEIICNKEDNLRSLDVKNTRGQIILATAWETLVTNKKYVETLQIKVTQILQELVDGKQINDTLMQLISRSCFASLVGNSDAINIYNSIRPELQESFLSVTSSELLENINNINNLDIWSALEDYLIKKGFSDFLNKYRNDLLKTVPLFARLSFLSTQYILDYLHYFKGKVTALNAEQIGVIAANRHSREIAEFVLANSTRQNNWRFGLAKCVSLLGFFDQVKIAAKGLVSNVTISADQWWENTEELVINLYPSQTSVQTIWRNSGGNPADLILGDTMRNAWTDALSNLRKNKFKDVSIGSLLKAIKRDYPNNKNVKTIIELFKEIKI